MPLAMVGTGESRSIRRIGGSPAVRAHLENLGFVEGEIVRVVSDISGNLIVQVKDARIAISRELAMKILV
ncbi:MAG: FeoA family protein [Clostridia bacterium]|nr:FeoA family protein [Clostridia bacterium]